MTHSNGWTCYRNKDVYRDRFVAQEPERRTLVNFINDFNKNVKLLTLDLHRRYPTDSKIWRAKERILLATREDPELIIKEIGPYLFKFKDKIYSGDGKFFIANNYDTELKECDNEERKDLSAYIIPKAKETYQNLTSEERRQYHKLIIGMLDEYVEYYAAQRLDGLRE